MANWSWSPNRDSGIRRKQRADVPKGAEHCCPTELSARKEHSPAVTVNVAMGH